MELVTGIIICSRLDSERLPGKALKLINGVPCLQHLINRIKDCRLPIVVAVPNEQREFYEKALSDVTIFPSVYSSDPLKRMATAAKLFKFKNVLRITHDKIFVNPDDVKFAIQYFESQNADYLFGNRFIDGTGFEIIASDLVNEAAHKYSDVEFISYAVRSLSKKTVNYRSVLRGTNLNLMIDYPQDHKLMEVVFSQLGNDCTINQVIRYLNDNPEIRKINHKPLVSVYTCAYNAQEWIERAMNSVVRNQKNDLLEYIVVDDFSSDKTPEIVASFANKYPFMQWVRNEKNLGLSSSCNVALKMARGRYVMRLDADDFFTSITAVQDMAKAIESSECDVIYPNNYLGSYMNVQKGSDCHHVGGAIFDKRALNHIKFTDGLRGYEGLDLFVRAKDQLKIGYHKKPIFMYTQREGSMSKTNLKEREKIRQKILSQIPVTDEIDSEFSPLEIGIKT